MGLHDSQAELFGGSCIRRVWGHGTRRTRSLYDKTSLLPDQDCDRSKLGIPVIRCSEGALDGKDINVRSTQLQAALHTWGRALAVPRIDCSAHWSITPLIDDGRHRTERFGSLRVVGGRAVEGKKLRRLTCGLGEVGALEPQSP